MLASTLNVPGPSDLPLMRYWYSQSTMRNWVPVSGTLLSAPWSTVRPPDDPAIETWFVAGWVGQIAVLPFNGWKVLSLTVT